MTIAAAGAAPYDLPLRHAWASASARAVTRSGVLFWIRDGDGHIGLGDAAPMPGHEGAELPRIRRGVNALVEVVRGAHALPEEPPEFADPLPAAVRHAWVQARLDLAARAAGQPLAELLAGEAIADRVLETNLALPVAAEPDSVAAAKRAVDEGYRCLKVKMGPEPHEVRRITAIRLAVGPHVQIRLDANGSWGDQAAHLLRVLRHLDIEYVEQPLPPGRENELTALRSDDGIPIAADESASHLPHALNLIQHRAVDAIIVKPMALGGIDRARSVIDAARKHGVRAIVTDSAESAVGRAGALHTALLLSSPRPVCGLASGEWLQRDLTTGFPRVDHGRLRVPDTAGLGIDLAVAHEVR